MTTELTMNELIELYPTRRKVCEQYYGQLRSRVLCFIEHCGDDAIKPDDVTPARLQGFIDKLGKAGLAADTVRGYYRAAIAVKNFAKELEIGKVYLPKPGQKITEGFTLDEIRLLLGAAAKSKGKLSNGVKHKHFWRAAIHSAFSTGLRAGDLLRVAADDIKENGSLDLIQHKTGKPVRVRFSGDALKWIKKHGQPEAMPWPHTFTWFERCFDKLRDEAGVKRGT